ncbi:MAG: ArnT family glycosyltransferase [Fusobacteriaceae bacterium]
MFQITKKKCIGIISLFFLFFVIPMMFLRFPDVRNELKYFVIADDMIKNNNYLIMKYFGELYPDKPPLYFWILIFFKKNFKEYFYPLFLIFASVIPSYIISVTCFNLASKVTSIKNAFVYSLMITTLPFMIGASAVIRMDMFMSMFIVFSLYIFFTTYFGLVQKSDAKIYLMYFFMGVGILIKGGAAFAVPIITIFTFLLLNKDLKYFKHLKIGKGLLIIFGLIAIWFLALYFSKDGIQYIKLLLGQETVGRMLKSKAHTYPFYYYIKNTPLAYAPYSLFFICGVLYYILKIKSFRDYKIFDNFEKIVFSWFIGSFIFFSLLSGKLEIYMLPLTPGILGVAFCFMLRIKNTKLFTIFIGIVATLFLATSIYSNFAFELSKNILTPTTAKIFAVVVGLPSIYTLWTLRKKNFEKTMFAHTFMLVGLVITIIFSMPKFSELESLKPVVKYINENYSKQTDKIVLADFDDARNMSYLVNKNLLALSEDEVVNNKGRMLENKNAIVIAKRKLIASLEKVGYKVLYRNNSYAILKK